MILFNYKLCLFLILAFFLEPGYITQTDSERTDTAADGETTATEVCTVALNLLSKECIMYLGYSEC